jgi:hypothetical protein
LGLGISAELYFAQYLRSATGSLWCCRRRFIVELQQQFVVKLFQFLFELIIEQQFGWR